MADIKIAKGYIPGSIGRVAELHGIYYHKNWDFKFFFEAKVATEISEFLGRYNEKQDGFWTASMGGRVEGSITIDGIHAEKEGKGKDASRIGKATADSMSFNRLLLHRPKNKPAN